MRLRINSPSAAVFLIPLAALVLGGWISGSDATAASPPDPPAPAPDTSTQVQMRNVDFYVDPKIALKIDDLDGTMRSRNGGPIVFDDSRSFIISIDRADVGLTGPDLSVLLNKYVFNYRGSPLSDLRVSIKRNELIQTGKLHKVFALPFEIRASVSVAADGRLRMHPHHTEILGLHVDQLMKGLGLSLEEIINLSKAKGASVDGNDILLSPLAIMPPPEIAGRVTNARLEDGRIVLTFGSPSRAALLPIPDTTVRSYMYYRGGTLRFGKLEMHDADMLITELNPVGAFGFDLKRYMPQLVAGYSRTLPSGGLEVWMQDVQQLGEQASSPSPCICGPAGSPASTRRNGSTKQ